MTKPWTTDAGIVFSKADLETELAQCEDRGCDLAALEAEIADVLTLDIAGDLGAQGRAGKLLDRLARLPTGKARTYREPDGLVRIRKARRRQPKVRPPKFDKSDLTQKVLGGWLGRSVGCTLGRTVEGRTREQIEGYLRAQGQWPLTDYFSCDVDDETRQKFGFPGPSGPCYSENITCMPGDDDLNYTIIAKGVIEAHGPEFTPSDVARFWLNHLPPLRTYTAERVAYRNLMCRIPPPDMAGKVPGRWSSATYRNPFREWIGAQIRGDFYGYICPGDPERAAGYAWRDACVSHVANGIYGAMWVAAMIAGAHVVARDVEKVIRIGLGQIPHRSRLHEAVTEVVEWYAEHADWQTAVDRIHIRWDQTKRHHWCHTISNAQVVSAALLWGELSFTETICRAVMVGFDTDCNAATAGSILGVMLTGGASIGYEWTDPLGDTLKSHVVGWGRCRISKLATETVALIGRCGQVEDPEPDADGDESA